MLSNRYKYDDVPILKLNELQLETKKLLNKKVTEGIYKFETVPCLVCGNENKFEVLAEKDRYGLRNQTVVCENCGLVQSNPRFTQESFNQFYNIEYRALYNGKETASDLFFNQQKFRGEIIYSILNRFSEFNNLKKPFVLEVGCASGGILQVFKEKGCTIKGIDLGEEYVKYGIEKHNLDLEIGSLNDLSFLQKPDVIIYSNVLEHLTNPLAELHLIRSVLNPSGLLFIEVPGIKNIHINYRSDFLLYLQNAHVYHFSSTTLTNILVKAGYNPLYKDEYIRSVSKIGEQLIFHPENDYPLVLNYLKEKEQKRSVYLFTFYGIKETLLSIGLKVASLVGLRGVLRRVRKLF